MRSKRYLLQIIRKTLPFAVALSILSTLAHAQVAGVSPEGHYRTDEGNLVLAVSSCQTIPCELNFKGAVVRIMNGTSIALDSLNGVRAIDTDKYSIRFTSNLPVVRIRLRNRGVTQYNLTGANILTLEDGHRNRKSTWSDDLIDLKEPAKQVSISQSYFHAYLISIEVTGGVVSHLKDDLQDSSKTLVTVYKGILENLDDFRKIVAKGSSDSRHLTRLDAQVKNQLNLMVDKNGRHLLPVTHRKVTEGSRMVMVLSAVLEEILEKYDFTSDILTPLKPAKDALIQLSNQIRSAYGWEEGLAGSGSKALAALSAVLDSELKSMNDVLASVSADESLAKTFNGLVRANNELFLKVSASNAGDAAGMAAARNLLNHWNSQQFQQILSNMMNAPKLSKSELQNRILMALTAVESIKDYVDPKGESGINIAVPANVRSKLP